MDFNRIAEHITGLKSKSNICEYILDVISRINHRENVQMCQMCMKATSYTYAIEQQKIARHVLPYVSCIMINRVSAYRVQSRL